ncbi:hypothetical protein [Aeromicrobium sp. Root472D3]|uniref:hypothetical protein n=1 Tax=Aeromicrobium sp. Root472D3 TaxID=1736540 RepID=UPI0006F71CB3|nr:hypothetical protein [Aeromicrobium sp. Root472D3]KQX75886.1 hypothetical protein ASD10_12305 [Aeromicrobium sp. Root472D3]
MFHLVATLLTTFSVGVVGLVSQDGASDVAIAVLALAVGAGSVLMWIRDTRRYRAARQQFS